MFTRPLISALLASTVVGALANSPTDIAGLGTPSQTHSHSSGLYPPELAIDGDTATFNHTESQTPGAAWRLHFPDEHEISSVEIVSRDCCAGRLNGAYLRLFDAEVEMVFEIGIIDSGPLSTFTAQIPAGTMAREIHIGFDPGEEGIVHLAEVRVFSPSGEAPLIRQFTASGNKLTWEVEGAETIEIYGIGGVAPSGSLEVSPAVSRAYFLTATNACDTVRASAAVLVEGEPLLPRISELSAYPDDWIEIWNPGDTAIDLAGWHLSDDPGNPGRWTFPAGQTLAAGSVLVVVPPFGLAREAGSYLALTAPSGTPVTEITYPEQFEGKSYGFDLGGELVYFLEPSPGAINGGPATRAILSGVDFSIARGLYDTPVTLTLTPKTPGASVIYSLGGAAPDTQFTAPIEIATTTVVRAIEILDGSQPSRPEAHTYLFLEDVQFQPEFPAGTPDDWQPESASGALAPIPRRSDYEMDPDIVASAPFTDRGGERFDITEALSSLPSMCLTLPAAAMWDPADGLHANALKRGRAWEREISMEILDPASGSHFHTSCGLRIHGGRGRVAEMLKKSFRLYFRGDYGATKFDFPLFGGVPAKGIDHLVLRGGNGKTWASPWRDLSGGGNSLPRVTYLRDQFLRDTQIAMGQPGYAGSFVHLYINGIYWGLYNPVERPGGNYAANHFGGDETDYDFIKWANALPPQNLDGDLIAWDELITLTRSNPLQNWGAIQGLLDVDNLADYMIANFYVGNSDWVRNNAYAFRSRRDDGEGRFRFTCWDGEESLLDINRDSTTDGRDESDTPLELHNRLRAAVPNYRLAFADRIHRHLIDEEGVLLPAGAIARHNGLANLVDRSIAAESARWGDLLRPDQPYTRDGDWLTEVNNITRNYLTRRPAISFAQMKADGLYPETAAPVATLVGGTHLLMASASGTIWFTEDGSDPRLPDGSIAPSARTYTSGGGESPIVATADWRYLDNGVTPASPDWTSSSFDDAAWALGRAPLGYGTIGDATLNTEIGSGPDPFDKPITNYFRHAFEIADSASLGVIELRYFRDDGIVIYLNGVEIERSNLPTGTITPSTRALTSITGSAESAIHSIPVPAGLFNDGTNLLAVELHQDDANSSDLGFDLSLVERRIGIRLMGDTHVRARALDGGEWSALEDEQFRILDAADSLVVSEIMYHPAAAGAAELAAGFTDEDDFEFIEIHNVGRGTILLDGLRFTKGVDAMLSGILAPGGFALVVANSAACEQRYGMGLPIVGVWQAGDQLDNAGERIRLLDADGLPILDFHYGDRGAWPSSADGGGNSLVLIAPQSGTDPSIATSWRPSSTGGGNPGTSDATKFPGGSEAELLAYAVGKILPPEIFPDGRLKLAVVVNPLADDVVGTLEISTDLQTWQPAVPQLQPSGNGAIVDGFSKLHFTVQLDTSSADWFLRYRVNLRE